MSDPRDAEQDRELREAIERVAVLEKRTGRHSIGVRDIRRSQTDVEEKYSDFERAVIAHVRRIEKETDKQTVMLQWGRWVITPLAVAVASVISALIHSCGKG